MLRRLKISKDGSESTFLCQSRSDDTLLTVSFNLRNRIGDDTLSQILYRPQACCNRRLKSTVNKVPSLRDLYSLVTCQSRSDDTLLTVSFNLRKTENSKNK